MPAEPFKLPGDFNGEVRLFPLPDLVVFPRNLLPLHIFESRYVEMLEDAIQGDRLITMATLEPGYESDYFSRPAISPFACIGRVTDHRRTEQGSYNLMLAGIGRAEIEREIEPVRSFRRYFDTLSRPGSALAPRPKLVVGKSQWPAWWSNWQSRLSVR